METLHKTTTQIASLVNWMYTRQLMWEGKKFLKQPLFSVQSSIGHLSSFFVFDMTKLNTVCGFDRAR